MSDPVRSLIYHHLGLGDCLICNGMVRHIAAKHTENDILYVFSKPSSLQSVKFMYRDDPRIHVFEMHDSGGSNIVPHGNVIQFQEHYKIDKYYPSGFAGTPEFRSLLHMSFDEIFYHQLSIPFEEKWNSFKVIRDKNREEELFHKLNPNNEPYIFLQDDGRFKINMGRVSTGGLRVISPPSSTDNNQAFPSEYTIFDYLTLIERAKEVHVIPSSFLFMIDLMQDLALPDLYCHWYTRQHELASFLIPKRKRVWK